ncbi:hypothetical protein [Bradyrhizobium sp. USDA 4486]
MPKQRCGLFASQPSVARFTFRRERHAHDAAVKAFFCVVVNRGAKCLKVAASTAWTATMLGIPRTGLGVNLREHLATPILVETFDPRLNLVLLAWLANVRQID